MKSTSPSSKARSLYYLKNLLFKTFYGFCCKCLLFIATTSAVAAILISVLYLPTTEATKDQKQFKSLSDAPNTYAVVITIFGNNSAHLKDFYSQDIHLKTKLTWIFALCWFVSVLSFITFMATCIVACFCSPAPDLPEKDPDEEEVYR